MEGRCDCKSGGAFMKGQFLLRAVVMILAFTSIPQAQAPSPTLKKAAEFDLPGPPGKRFDY
jgi:hypothetical protein